jgi:hypothetical protein
LTAAIFPATGQNSSDTALTDSMVPNGSSASHPSPTFGISTKTTSPSCLAAKSVMPTRSVPSLCLLAHS